MSCSRNEPVSDITHARQKLVKVLALRAYDLQLDDMMFDYFMPEFESALERLLRRHAKISII